MREKTPMALREAREEAQRLRESAASTDDEEDEEEKEKRARLSNGVGKQTKRKDLRDISSVDDIFFIQK